MKEQKLFGWDKECVDGYGFRKLTEEEKKAEAHSDWHFVWKGGKVGRFFQKKNHASPSTPLGAHSASQLGPASPQVQRAKTTPAMEDFYKNKKAIADVVFKCVPASNPNLRTPLVGRGFFRS